MGEHTVDVPLWDDEGLMFSTPAELTQALNLSAELVADIVAWADEWQVRADTPDHDAWAAQLVRRLARELNYEVSIVYKP